MAVYARTSNIDSMADFDGKPLRSYAFYAGRVSAEVAASRLAQSGQMAIRSVSDSQLALSVKMANGSVVSHNISCDTNQRVWFVTFSPQSTFSGNSLATLLQNVHATLFSTYSLAPPPQSQNQYVAAPRVPPQNNMYTAGPPMGTQSIPQNLYTPGPPPSTGTQFTPMPTPTMTSEYARAPLVSRASSSSPSSPPADSSRSSGFGTIPLSQGSKLAADWGLSQLPCFYESQDEEERLPNVCYLLRPSSTSNSRLVLAVRNGDGTIVRFLIARLKPNVWQVGSDPVFSGGFADFIRSILPQSCRPFNDPLRVKQAATTMTLRTTESIEVRAQNRLETTQSVHSALLTKPAVAKFQGVESNVYGSVDAARRFAKENNEDVAEGTEWTAVARTEALASLNSKHNDLNGVSLASEDYYFFDIDTFGTNALLSGMPTGTYLLRLNSKMTQFVVSFVRENNQVTHILLVIEHNKGTVCAENTAKFSSVREMVSKIPAFQFPLSRRTHSREFVDCTIVLRAKPLGIGAGGIVLRGRLDKAVDVAVKRLIATHNDTEETDVGKMSEAEAMLKIRPHPNVNRLFGLVLKPLSLVVEFCDGGSLDQIIGVDSVNAYATTTVFTMQECWQLARDIARGIAHLHEARIVHRDIASRNILISLPLTPKVCDFGMSRMLGEDEVQAVTSELRGPIKWQAPEQMRGATRVYSYKSDVFSYAVLLTEIVGNTLPWVDITNREAAFAVCAGKRTAIHERCNPTLKSMIVRCWDTNPDVRPTMAEAAARLDVTMPAGDQYDRVPQAYDDIADL